MEFAVTLMLAGLALCVWGMTRDLAPLNGLFLAGCCVGMAGFLLSFQA